ncbi:6168_t:CDS:1 [Funneliformis caledonium]|uniref:6168_t:CDS:1 n=1 Tax=Funneliformis caledonium TaxID=1117310 RepID=A0A9N9CJI1_9GLOM|nr:6168_t:CDS:1 [Funneliformis caledonium]
MLMNQTSLKHLDFDFYTRTNYINIPFINYPGGEDCLRDLSELKCNSNIYPEFFYKLSRICHNLRSLKIIIEDNDLNGLIELVSVQRHIKYLELIFHDYLTDNRQLFTKFPDTLTKLRISGGRYRIPWSLISELSNLKELSLFLFNKIGDLKYFKNLQHAVFPQLQVLTFGYECPDDEYLTKFLENNGKNLKELGLCENINVSLNLKLGKYCPNLRSLCTAFHGDIEPLKGIFNGCQQLERLEILRCEFLLDERELLEIVVEFSPKKFYELSIDLGVHIYSETFQWGLRSILERWANRVPCIPLSLTFASCSELDIELSKSNIKIIEKFKKLGVIKEFKISNVGYD